MNQVKLEHSASEVTTLWRYTNTFIIIYYYKLPSIEVRPTALPSLLTYKLDFQSPASYGHDLFACKITLSRSRASWSKSYSRNNILTSTRQIFTKFAGLVELWLQMNALKLFFSISQGTLPWQPLAQPGGRHPRNCVHKRIPGCTVKINTQNCAWFGRQISLITAMSFREAMPLRTTHQGLCPLDPAGGLPVPQTPCAPTSKSWLRH